MAIYHFSVKVIGRSAGRSAVAAAAYRSASRLHDNRLKRDHDFTDKPGVVHSEVLLPENLPEEWLDRERLWNDVEAFEKLRNSQLSREIEFAIPRELTPQQGISLARDFVRSECVEAGMIADLNVHWDIGADGLARPHAHAMLTMREAVIDHDGEAGFGRKVIEWNRTQVVRQWRECWASCVNERLAELDMDLRVDHRSFAAQGIALEPQGKIGPAASRMANCEFEPEPIKQHRGIAYRNGETIIASPQIALDAITHSRATFTNLDLAILAHRHSDGIEQYDAVMSALRTSPDLVMLGQDRHGEDRFTSRDMIEAEQRMLRAAASMAERESQRVSPVEQEAALARAAERGMMLSGGQRAGFEHVTGTPDLCVVIGHTGAGRNAVLAAAREAWESAGAQVRGIALSGNAARRLESGSGIASRALASLENAWSQHREFLTSGDVLVLDEAGMFGTRQMERVLTHAAQVGAKVILVGDPQHLALIEVGAPLRAIHERLGGTEIGENRRQHDEWQHTATRALAEGRTGDAICAYDDAGMVHACGTRNAARSELVARWDRDRQANPHASRIILAHADDEVHQLNKAARSRMRAAGDLGDDITLKVERGIRSFAPGDQIMFQRSERCLGVRNAALARIEQVSEEAMAVRTDDGRSVSFKLADYADLDHGYAAAIHSARGVTVDRTHVLLTPGIGSHDAYLALSRHREGLELHFGRDDFVDQKTLVRALSGERVKDAALGLGDLVPARSFAERRGIALRERGMELTRKIPGRVLDAFGEIQHKVEPLRSLCAQQETEASGEIAIGGEAALRRERSAALIRHARALDAIFSVEESGGIVTAELGRELSEARAEFDAVRPYGARDAEAACARDPSLAPEAANGNIRRLVSALQLETGIRSDVGRRADTFVERWNDLGRMSEQLYASGDYQGFSSSRSAMAAMAKSLERDPQLESVLTSRKLALGIQLETVQPLSRELMTSYGLEAGRGPGIGI